MWGNVASICGQATSSYLTSKVSRLNSPIPGRTGGPVLWDFLHLRPEMLPRAKSWTTCAHCFLLNCQSNEVIPPDLGGMEWGEGTQKLRVLFSQTPGPQTSESETKLYLFETQEMAGVLWERVSFFLTYKDPQVLGEVEAGGGGHFPFCYSPPSPQDILLNLKWGLWSLTIAEEFTI